MSNILLQPLWPECTSFGRQVPEFQEQHHFLQDKTQLGLPQAGNHRGSCRSVAVHNFVAVHVDLIAAPHMLHVACGEE